LAAAAFKIIKTGEIINLANYNKSLLEDP